MIACRQQLAAPVAGDAARWTRDASDVGEAPVHDRKRTTQPATADHDAAAAPTSSREPSPRSASGPTMMACPVARHAKGSTNLPGLSDPVGRPGPVPPDRDDAPSTPELAGGSRSDGWREGVVQSPTVPTAAWDDDEEPARRRASV